MEVIRPAFPGQRNAIVFASNDLFCPYMTVMIRSVLDHAAPERFYDILVLHTGIRESWREQLRQMAGDLSHVSIRFADMKGIVDKRSFYVGGKEDFTVDTYSRLWIPSLLSEEYERALYLDGDMVALTDVAPLLDVDLEGYLLASSPDMLGIAEYYKPGGDRKAWRDSILPGEDPDSYFIAGMLVFNLPEFRRTYTQEEILHLAASRDWLQHDQDILNVLCRGGKAKLLDASWDVMMPSLTDCLPPRLQKELDASLAAPKILHYGGDKKPWKSVFSPWLEQFWETACRTPFYGEIIRRLLEERPGTVNEQMLLSFEKGQTGFRYIAKFFFAWLRFKLRRLRG